MTPLMRLCKKKLIYTEMYMRKKLKQERLKNQQKNNLKENLIKVS